MAGEDYRLTTLRGVLASIKDDALALLASPGLVRRARKDLESGEVIAVEGTDEEGLTVRVGEVTVSMPHTGPVAAKCTCPAQGVCRHILSATMFLQRHLGVSLPSAQAKPPTDTAEPTTEQPTTAARPSPPDASARKQDTAAVRPGQAREELLAVSPERLIKWAKTKAVRDAAAMLEEEADVEILDGESVVVTFKDAGIQCHYFAGATLDGMITNAPERSKYKYLAAAVLAFQRHHGVHAQTVGRAEPKHRALSSSGSEVLDMARSALADAMAIGLSHLSPTMRQRLDMLSVSAHGADLPRLASALRSLAEEVELLLDRHAQADEGRLFSSLGQTLALVDAIAGSDGQPSPELAGRFQSQYEDFETLDLTGVACWPWRTKSGYDGLTMLAWCSAEKRWHTWSESRPDHIAGAKFVPAEHYRRPMPWLEGQPPETLCRRRFRLTAGRRSRHHRLSSSAQCRVQIVEDSRLSRVDFGDCAFSDWSALAARAARAFPVGLELPVPLAGMVLLKPARWGRKEYDELTQTFRWPVGDAAGRQVDLALPYDDLAAPAIDALQRVQPRWHGVWGVVGQITFDRRGYHIRPFALLGKRLIKGEQVCNIYFEQPVGRVGRLAAKILGAKVSSAMGSETPEAESLPSPWSPQVEREMAGLEGDLLHLAERGCAHPPAELTQRITGRQRWLSDQGFSMLAPTTPGPAAVSPAGAVAGASLWALRVRFLCRLHREVGLRAMLEASLKGHTG
jgi:hypothetical protein